MLDLKFKYGFISLLPMFLFAWVACTPENNDALSEDMETNIPIQWSVQSADIQDARTLLNDNSALQRACTPGLGNQAIGIWSVYEKNNVLTEHVLGNPIGDVALVYQPSTSTNTSDSWIYGERIAYWKHDAVYYFNTYFPNEDGLSSITNDTTSLTGFYDTETTQTDLMVSRVKVDTGDEKFNGSPVRLSMIHGLSAVCFNFQTTADITMKLKSFALENEDTEGLKKSGTMVYTNEGITWIPDEGESGLFYEWSTTQGISFSKSVVASAYQAAPEENLYTSNSGCILIIPQEYKSKTNMIFEIEENETPIKVALPERHFLPGYKYTYLIKMSANNRLTLECKVQPWTLQEENMEFNDQVSVNDGEQLVWSEGSYQGAIDTDNAEVTLSPGKQLVGQFRIATPEGATWHAEFIPQDAGSVNAFEFVNEDGATSSTISGNVGELSTLRIHPVKTSITTNRKAILRILVKTADGRTIVVRELMPFGFEKSEYTIIQSI